MPCALVQPGWPPIPFQQLYATFATLSGRLDTCVANTDCSPWSKGACTNGEKSMCGGPGSVFVGTYKNIKHTACITHVDWREERRPKCESADARLVGKLFGGEQILEDFLFGKMRCGM